MSAPMPAAHDGEQNPPKSAHGADLHAKMSALTPPTDDAQRGLYRKYSVRRENDDAGKHDECRYFVLDPQHDFHAWTALEAYALACQPEFPELAKDLFAWLTETGMAFKSQGEEFSQEGLRDGVKPGGTTQSPTPAYPPVEEVVDVRDGRQR